MLSSTFSHVAKKQPAFGVAEMLSLGAVVDDGAGRDLARGTVVAGVEVSGVGFTSASSEARDNVKRAKDASLGIPYREAYHQLCHHPQNHIHDISIDFMVTY